MFQLVRILKENVEITLLRLISFSPFIIGQSIFFVTNLFLDVTLVEEYL